nr:DEAD/DEAH box helicase [uncultured Roseateles sp.]
MTQLRPYQADAKRLTYEGWQRGRKRVLNVLPTGAGKTVLFSDILAEYRGASCAVAHRQELVSQISLALGSNGVRHSLLAPQKVVRSIVALHQSELGRSYFDPSARCRVAGVDTLIRLDPKDKWLSQVGLWVMDEAHHVLTGNKWGRAIELFPNAYGLGVTATPVRADGKGLGAHADGVFDEMIVGPTMRDLINAGYLTDYRIFAPPSDLDLSSVNVGESGEFVGASLRKAVHKSHITGDVVEHYARIAPGKLGVTFAVDIEHATEITAAFNARGVPAAVVSSETPDDERMATLRRFRRRELLQLVNVDLFGEGFDLPAIEVVSMARPTMSYSLFAQQFGRALRLLDGKAWAIIVDHVGNVLRHGLPDARRRWTLDRRERGTRGERPADVIPTWVCPKCTNVWERIHKRCLAPGCGGSLEPASRGAPEQVDGDLSELSPEVLARLRGEIDRIDGAPQFPRGVSAEAAGAIKRRHWERQQAQHALREAMALYGGQWTHGKGETLEQAQRRFFYAFGIDVATAQTLGAREAAELEQRVRSML